MKKQIDPTIKAHLIRSAVYFLSLLAVLAIPFALAQRSATRRSVPKPGAVAGVPQLATTPSIPTFVGVALPAPKHGAVPMGSIKAREDDYLIDLAALDIHPATGPLPLRALAAGA